MSRLRVNQIVNLSGNGPVEFSKGFSLPTGFSLNTNIQVTGIATASSFVGDGSNIRNFIPNEVSISKSVALSIVI